MIGEKEERPPLIVGGSETTTKRPGAQDAPESLCENIVSWADSARALMDAVVNVAKRRPCQRRLGLLTNSGEGRGLFDSADALEN